MNSAETSSFVPVSPGVRRRADGAEIRKMRARDIRDLFRGEFSITVPWWIGFNPDGSPMRSRFACCIVGGATIEKVLKSVATHERMLAKHATQPQA